MSPRAYCTNLNAEMPALVRTHSSSSTDSSAPSTPVTESGSPFEFYERVRAAKCKAVRVEVPISSQTGSLQTRRHPMAQVKTDVDHHSAIQLVQMLFLLAMLLMGVVRVLSWVPICLWIIMREVWIVAKHELQIDVTKAVGGTVTVAVVAMIVSGFLLL